MVIFCSFIYPPGSFLQAAEPQPLPQGLDGNPVEYKDWSQDGWVSAMGESEIGHHTVKVSPKDQARMVQINLGASSRADWVILVPARGLFEGKYVPGFRFPNFFRVEVAKTPDFSDATVLLDHTQHEFPHPSLAPVRIPIPEGLEFRYVRVLGVDLRGKEPVAADFALAEILVLDGEKNLATGITINVNFYGSDNQKARQGGMK